LLAARSTSVKTSGLGGRTFNLAQGRFVSVPLSSMHCPDTLKR